MNRLFDELCSYGPENWGALSEPRATAFRGDFEAAMVEMLKEAPGNADVLQRAMASYLFRFEPSETSLYTAFAQRIRDTGWDGAVATLNYERLAELALRKAGVRIVLGPAAMEAGTTELCLPHGACHLFGNVRTESSAGGQDKRAVNIVSEKPVIIKPARRPDRTEVFANIKAWDGRPIHFGGQQRTDSEEIRVIHDPNVHAQELRTSELPPIMCYIEPQKRNRTGVTFIATQRRRFGDLVSSASGVAIVGVRVNERDAHLWGPLARTQARIVYCGGTCGAKQYAQWRENCRKGRNDEVLDGYFGPEFDRICSEVGLTS
jgi:hypothetical protein